MKMKIPFTVALILLLASCAPTDTNQISELAESWVLSSYESKDAAF